jgi:hypothetical protein
LVRGWAFTARLRAGAAETNECTGSFIPSD